MNLNVKKDNLLFLLHMPPPVHGSSVIGSYIKDSKLINETFDCYYLNVLASSSISRTGKISPNKLFGFVATFIKLIYQLILHRPNLCYIALTTTGAAFFKDVLLVMVLKIFKVKRVYHLHNKGIALHQHKNSYRFFYTYVFKDTPVILLSKSLYNDISSFVRQENIYICPNGIPAPHNEIAKETEKNKFAQVLFLSNLIESKGIHELLKACIILRDNQLCFHCKFIGGEGDITGKELNMLITQMGLSKFVSYEGKKYGAEKQLAFCNADIFVFPTYYPNECFPLVLLEAMSYSLPVITTAEGGISDIVQDGTSGYLITPRDEKSLSEKLQILVQDKEMRTKMGNAGKVKYCEEFTLEIFEKRLAFILNQCVK